MMPAKAPIQDFKPSQQKRAGHQVPGLCPILWIRYTATEASIPAAQNFQGFVQMARLVVGHVFQAVGQTDFAQLIGLLGPN